MQPKNVKFSGFLPPDAIPEFAIAFDTRSETGEEVSTSLKVLFLSGTYGQVESVVPSAAQVEVEPDSEVIQGYYLLDKGYPEAGVIAGRFEQC